MVATQLVEIRHVSYDDCHLLWKNVDCSFRLPTVARPVGMFRPRMEGRRLEEVVVELANPLWL